MTPKQVTDFFRVLDGCRHVERWNGFFMFDRPSVAEHHFRVVHWVILITKYLKTKGVTLNDKLLAEAHFYAPYHDSGEKFTGDVRHDVKRYPFPELGDLLKKVEKFYMNEHAPFNLELEMNNISERAKLLVKCADILDFTYDAVCEIRLGNIEREYKMALDRGYQILANFQKGYPADRLIEATTELFSELIKPLGTSYDATRFVFPHKLSD